jgi:uncharacterized protein with HEPN domain
VSRDWRPFLADIIEHGDRVERLLLDQSLDSFEQAEVLRQAILFSLLDEVRGHRPMKADCC